jgi:polar amino acid transport system substrate-binding protein
MSKSRKWLALALVLALAFSVVGLGGCAKEEPAEEPTEEPTEEPVALETIEAGKLLVGSDTAFPPFESMNGDVAEGFDVDLMNAIGEKLGLEVVFMTEIFDTLIPTLKAGGKFDVIASGMTIKPERQEEIDFTDPYYDSNQSLVMKKGTLAPRTWRARRSACSPVPPVRRGRRRTCRTPSWSRSRTPLTRSRRPRPVTSMPS